MLTPDSAIDYQQPKERYVPMYFIANFNFLTDQQQSNESERRHGSFSMMVQADTADRALGLFRDSLIRLKTTTSFFSGRCNIYIAQLIEFTEFPQDEAVLLNLKSFAGDPVLPHIACVVPTENNNACQIQTWEDNQPLNEGRANSLFLQFN